jgi:uncharacterized membrane protein
MDKLIRQLGETLARDGDSPFSAHDRRLLRHLARRLAAGHPHQEDAELSLTFGQRTADAVARFGGSWTFILSFLAFLIAWSLLNSALLRAPFDPFPYIFLNLLLSMLAAVQAPLILMSQNREAERDRHRAQLDYAINLKAEREIADLHAKLDTLTRALQPAALRTL